MRLLVPTTDQTTSFDASAKVITWGKRLDLLHCLRSNLSCPNEAAPLFTFYRLIALTFEGHEADLRKVLADVKTPSRQGYAPHIHPERVERAIALEISGGL